MSTVFTMFTIIGAGVVVWWLFGMTLVAFFCQHYVEEGAPITARLSTLFSAGFAIPLILITTGSLPTILLMPADATPEQEAKFDEWRKANCNCPNCKARRGER